MNNRFKFRSWHEPTKTMEYNGLWTGRDWDKKLCDCNFKLMQCTSLKDKNGKLIYEGDILKLSEFTKPVEVKYRALGFVLRREPSNTIGYDNDKYIPEDCEVIGNIYENKELLEEYKDE